MGGGLRLEERELVERARRGDADAYGELVGRYAEIAFRTAYLIVRSAAEAEDAAQDGFVKAYIAMPRFRPEAPFRPWLLRIVANEARNRRRAGGRRQGLALRAASAGTEADPSASPEAALEAAENRARLLHAIEGLREEERLAVSLRYFLDLSEAESATVLGWPRGTVKSRLSRALGHLRERFRAEGGADG